MSVKQASWGREFHSQATRTIKALPCSPASQNRLFISPAFSPINNSLHCPRIFQRDPILVPLLTTLCFLVLFSSLLKSILAPFFLYDFIVRGNALPRPSRRGSRAAFIPKGFLFTSWRNIEQRLRAINWESLFVQKPLCRESSEEKSHLAPQIDSTKGTFSLPLGCEFKGAPVSADLLYGGLLTVDRRQ